MAFDKKIAELHNKIDCSYNDLNVKYVESQFASTSAPKHPQQLPGKQSRILRTMLLLMLSLSTMKMTLTLADSVF